MSTDESNGRAERITSPEAIEGVRALISDLQGQLSAADWVRVTTVLKAGRQASGSSIIVRLMLGESLERRPKRQKAAA